MAVKSGGRGISSNSKKFLVFTALCAFMWLTMVFSSGYETVAYYTGNKPLSSVFRNVSLPSQNGTTSLIISVQFSNMSATWLKYVDTNVAYKKALSAFQRHTYNTNERYIQYGQPVSEILPQNSTQVKRILGWTSVFGKRNWLPPKITCSGEITCATSTNRSDLSDSHAVIMHARDFRSLKDLPAQRLPHQRWVYYLMESPFHTGLKIGEFNGVFNWTATYRRDADLPQPYFAVEKRGINLTDAQYEQFIKDITREKTKHSLSYMNSNCNAKHTKRLAYIRELQQYMPVDTYGACLPLKCERNTRKCDDTMRQYKFYLAMENSHCRDYITEKVAQPLFMWNSVPVVMGGADPGDYEDVLPPGSYIHTSGFRSPKELAEYLHLLDNNPTLYEKYHRWRITHKQATGEGNWCNLCRKLHNESLPAQTYRDFIGWYNEDTCKI